MGIVSSIITENLIQKDGRRDITEVHIDHLGIKHFVRWTAINSATDINALMILRIPSLWENLIEQDINDAISQVQGGADPRAVTLKYATAQQAVKALLLWAFKNKAWEAWKVIPLIDSLTDTQLRNILEIDQTKVNKIRARIIGLKDIKTMVETDDPYIEGGV